MKGWLRATATAAQFLTRLPVPGGANAVPSSYRADIGRVLMLLPLAGGLIGAATALMLWLGAQIWPLPLAVLVALAVEARLTGALHEDAVADVCDAFGGGAKQEDVLRILKDSRIGSYGLVGLGLAVALRAGGLMAAAEPARAALVLVASGMLGRLTLLAVMAAVPPIPDRPGLGGAVATGAGWRSVAGGAALGAPILAGAAFVDAIALAVSLSACALFVAWFGALVRRRIGGATGDCLGCAAYAGMVLATLAFAARG
jgi:adenosylcobinamide-GDP ribazoletransferase